MKTEVIITVTIARVGANGRKTIVFERSVTEEDAFPGHLAQTELFTVAHAHLHPPRPLPDHQHD